MPRHAHTTVFSYVINQTSSSWKYRSIPEVQKKMLLQTIMFVYK